MSEIVIGVDLGGTNVKAALVSRDKKVIAKDSRPTNADGGPDAVMQVVQDTLEDLLKNNGINKEQVLAVGIGAPGPMNWQTGVVFSPPNLPGWHNVSLADYMQKRLDMPCFVDNDANVACYGEFWMGAGVGTESMAVLTLGTGVGGGVVTFGKLLRGIDGTAAELGHMKVQRDGRICGCGAKGCLETYASVSGLARTAIDGIQSGKTSTLTERCNGDLESIDGKMIFDAAEEGDEFAKWVFEETATWIGLGISSIINYQNPEKLVLCGGMIAAGDLLFEPVRRVAKANSFEVPGKRCEIVPAALGNDAGVLGCAGCALERLENQ